jgi:hypothetical protein
MPRELVKGIKKGPLIYGKGTGGPVIRPFTQITQGRINALLVDGGYTLNITILQKKVKRKSDFFDNFKPGRDRSTKYDKARLEVWQRPAFGGSGGPKVPRRGFGGGAPYALI